MSCLCLLLRLFRASSNLTRCLLFPQLYPGFRRPLDVRATRAMGGDNVAIRFRTHRRLYRLFKRIYVVCNPVLVSIMCAQSDWFSLHLIIISCVVTTLLCAMMRLVQCVPKSRLQLKQTLAESFLGLQWFCHWQILLSPPSNC